ncbi:hypothetical protein DN539_32245, partial [Burkholderia multivorans]|uniref:hypothetical protein n=1 Tax=Burkholderia multivorans TaxID=87883 RepID=UPI000DB37F13
PVTARSAELLNSQAERFDSLLSDPHDHWDHHLGAAALVAAGIDRVFASPAFAADQAASTWISLDALRTNPDTADFPASLPEDPGDLLVEVTPIAEAGAESTGVELRGFPVELSVLGGQS